MNPKDPLWHLPTRPRVANLIDELPDDFSDHAVTQQVRGYVRRLRAHGLDIEARTDGFVPVVSLTAQSLKALLRAVYLDGRCDEEEDAKLRPVFAAVADALPPVDHEAEARLEVTLAKHREAEVKRSLAAEPFNPYRVPHTPQQDGRDTCNCLSCRSDRLGVTDDRLTRRPYSRDGWR